MKWNKRYAVQCSACRGQGYVFVQVATGKHVHLSVRAEREVRRQWRRNGRCLDCGAALSNPDVHNRCPGCTETRADKRREANRLAVAILRQERRDQGRCVDCGKELMAAYRFVRCPVCRLDSSRRSRGKRNKRRK